MLVVFWELTSIFSFLLIGYWHQSPAARDGARMALIVTGTGGLCLLAGVLLIGRIVGSYDLDRVLAAGDAIRAHALYRPILILVLLGAFTKSAQFPFHFWLPNAMTAPTPVSAYLHSATMVKAGVFLLIRLSPALSGTNDWFYIVGSAGFATLLLGAFFALFQHDLKGLLAYSTISHLGLITALIGMDTPLATVAAIFHIVNHAVFKASLFMAAGIVDHETGTRDMRRLGGLRHAHADHRHARDRRLGGDGRGAAAERLPVQGDVLRRGGRILRRLAARPVDALDGARRQHPRGRLLAALHPQRLLRPAGHRPAEGAARAAVPDAAAGRDPRRRLPRSSASSRRSPSAPTCAAPRSRCSAPGRPTTASRSGTGSTCRWS